MATYLELADFLSPESTSGLRKKVAVAAFVAADNIRSEVDDGTASAKQRKRFAQRILQTMPNQSYIYRPDGGYALTPIEAIFRAVLIANKGASVAQINNATDAQIQTAVDNAVTFLAADFPDPVTP